MSPRLRCRWPRGCFQRPSLVDGRERGLCYFHAKVLEDLFTVEEKQRFGIGPADVISEEQLELARVLDLMRETNRRSRELVFALNEQADA